MKLNIEAETREEFEKLLDSALRADRQLQESVNRVAGGILAESVRAKLKKEHNLMIPTKKNHS